MNIQVIFQGLMLWWMLGPQPAMLIPNFANDLRAPHSAAITALPAAFGGNGCPAPFTLQTQTGECRFVLDGAGAPGGVRIAFDGGGGPTFSLSQFCALPSIVNPQQLTLAPEFTPPTVEEPRSGSSLTAWMRMIGGTAGSFTMPCISGPASPNCPRAVVWSVPPPTGGSVALRLDNLLDGRSIRLPLASGAIVTLVNEPPEDVLAGRAKEMRKRKHAHAHALSPAVTADWCLYYTMFRVDLPAVPCVSPQMPPRMSCGIAPPPSDVKRPVAIQTLACSNSQYP